MQENTYYVHDMACGGCLNSVTQSLLAIDGVKDVQANLQTKAVTIQFTNQPVNLDILASQVADAGYSLTRE
ncbi:cation-transporting ATPase [Suicoccus acidiformans]|uniref:Cation-transporting ATPase n=1 Tax=Suicoccus acidiformans TaxID=2036206 RepID=A0A347WMY8_9LACT|nr:heavy-metal-associated domain-containing protein [Suicoccus acidiformans]AXY26445.1 cation-transporting ATPase [Suicoccus acidiformans]